MNKLIINIFVLFTVIVIGVLIIADCNKNKKSDTSIVRLPVKVEDKDTGAPIDNAIVYHNGVKIGPAYNSPIQSPKPGDKVRIECAGYKTVEGKISESAITKGRLYITLSPDYLVVTITSNPAGILHIEDKNGTVIQDSTALPDTVKVKAGIPYRVEIRKANDKENEYLAYSDYVVFDSTKVKFDVKLEKNIVKQINDLLIRKRKEEAIAIAEKVKPEHPQYKEVQDILTKLRNP